MTVNIPEELVRSANLSEQEVKRELAVALFVQQKLTLGQASRLAGVEQFEFSRLLASRRINACRYGIEEFEEDLKTLGALGRL